INRYLKNVKLPQESEDEVADLDRQIVAEEVEVIIKNLKFNIGPRTNRFSREYSRALRQVLVPVLIALFNGTLQGNEISDSWKDAKIVVISKEGKDITTCASHRPISLINMDAKIYVKMLESTLSVLFSNMFTLTNLGLLLAAPI
uniref:Uncharacterized protein n=1 Tax=Chelonoidis abingdonii TaxID=106734 RepID=A0A8C0IRX8_CHEAB